MKDEKTKEEFVRYSIDGQPPFYLIGKVTNMEMGFVYIDGKPGMPRSGIKRGFNQYEAIKD